MKLASFYSAAGALRGGRLRKSPIVIVGTGRCGTTLLFHVLKTHPEIAIFPTEANDLWHPKSYPYKHRKIETPSMGEDPAEFSRRSLEAWPAGHAARIKRIFSGFQLAKGIHRRFFIQSAMTCYLLPSILEMWSDAKVVHLVRDGRPTVLSLTKKNIGKGFSSATDELDYRLEAARYWRDSVLEVTETVRRLQLPADRFLTMRYEDFCEAPNNELSRLCKFASISSDRFGYDLKRIKSRNFKANGAANRQGWQAVVDILTPGLIEYGYETSALKSPNA